MDDRGGQDRGPRDVVARVRASLAVRLAPGTRARARAIAGRDSARDVGAAARSIRSRWAEPGALDLPAPPYPVWSALRRSSRTEPAGPIGSDVLGVVVLPGEGSSSATVESVRASTVDRWRLAVLGAPATAGADQLADRGALDRWLAGLGDQPVVLLRAGDRVRPGAVGAVLAALHRAPGAVLVGWDDDVSGVVHHAPRFRPSWSPELLLAEDYPGRAFALRASAVLAAGGLDPADRHTAHWDLLLRADVPTDRALRITEVLTSVPARVTVPADRAVAVVQARLDRDGDGAVASAGALGGVRIERRPAAWPSVTVAIPTRHNREVLERCLRTVAASDYDDLEVVVVDNGGRTPERDAWYAGLDLGVPLRVQWWDEPFNYSAVNNLAARLGTGEVLVFLNDDTEARDPSWLREMVGWTTVPDIGVVGAQLLDAQGLVQHAGVVLGMGGFADHVFAGLPPGQETVYGPSDRTRDVLAVTGACLVVRRDLFDALGGFDERFVLCGSDVALGLSSVLAGRRNVVTPHAPLLHLESATRGRDVPVEDYFASYWRYSPWLFQGDPYWHPDLSLRSRTPRLRPAHEPPPAAYVGQVIGRDLTTRRATSDGDAAQRLAEVCRVRDADVAAVRGAHAAVVGPRPVRTVNWFVPDVDSPFYGGINTALRIADHLARNHGVANRFVVWGSPPDHFVRSALAAAFPALGSSEIVFYDASMDVSSVPPADAGVATLWSTAYALAHSPGTARKFYLVQDFEPMFYPAGAQYALAEESYRLGLYGLCNTDNLRRVYEDEYGGTARSFTPAVDDTVFHARGRRVRRPDEPVRVFVYARPGHWRNCWEIAEPALVELKRRLGDRVHIVAAGSRTTGASTEIEHLGLLDYRATGDLYRTCDVGLALQVSKHPSYLPLELMACGVPVVAFDNPWGHWLLRDGHNSLLARRSVPAVADALEVLCRDDALRSRSAANALADIAAGHADWEQALSGVHGFLVDPEAGRG